MKTYNKTRFISLLSALFLVVMMAIPNASIAVQPPAATLHVIKQVINDNGGMALAGHFNLHVKNTLGIDVAGSPAPGAGAPGTTYTLPPGTYEVSEDGTYSLSYGVSYSGDFDFIGGNTVTLNPGDNKTVIITNDDFDSFEGTPPATLHVIKQVINDNGGTAVAGDFSLHVKTPSGMGLADVGGSPAPGVESPGTTYTLPAGTYTVSEDAVAGYTASYSGDSDSSGKIVLSPGDNKTVIITNDDDPVLPAKATLHVIKQVINDNGGTAVAGDFTLHVKTPTGMGLADVNGSPAPGAASPGTTYTLPAGTYTVSEDAVAGYTASYSGDSDSSGNIVLSPGDNKTVIITNDDDPILPVKATLHVIKRVINDDGGTAVAGDFTLHVKTPTGMGLADVDGSPAPGVESPGTTYTLPAGTYIVSEDAVAGYTASYSGDSDSSGNIVLSSGDDKTVIITNDDILIPIEVLAPLDFSYGYINGYDDGNVGINDSLTREQVSASLYRILKQAGKTTDYIKPAVSDFVDLETNRWSYAAIEYFVSIGAISGDTTVVNPTEPVTRGEMAKIVAIANNMTDKRSLRKFSDLPESHKYYDYINMVVNYGLLKGDPNGQMNPDGFITRPEYVTMINRYIGRDDRYYVEGLSSLYKDLLPTHWAFKDLQRASFGFTTTIDSNGFFQVDPAQKISKADLDN